MPLGAFARDHLISIHTLRMEGDLIKSSSSPFGPISIHTLRMEGDSARSLPPLVSRTFQSTPSAWRVTDFIVDDGGGSVFQSTPSAWRVTPLPGPAMAQTMRFQSTPSAWRVTWTAPPSFMALCLFQSTPSAWRVTGHSSM